MSPQPCAAGCGQTIRRRVGLLLCNGCTTIARAAFEASVKGYHPNARQEAWFAFYAGKNPPAVEAARAALLVTA